MDTDFLDRHKFQFVSHCHVLHAADYKTGRIHINDDHHLLHIARGSGTLWIENEKFTMHPGTVAAIPPFVRFYFKTRAPFEMLNIHFRLWLDNGAPLEDYAALPLVFRPPYFNSVMASMRAMKKNTVWQPCIAHRVVICHLASNRLARLGRTAMDARLAIACRRLSSPDCSAFRAGELARMCGLSISQMNRLFRECFGISPHKFWEAKRFAEICRQLRTTGDTVAQIALRSGMQDAAYFSRWFGKIAGCAPTEFRCQHAI